MSRFQRASAFLLVVACVLVGGCGEGQKVGSEQLLEFQEQEGGGRLGERTAAPSGTPSSLTVGERTPAPTPKPQPSAAANFLDVALVKDSPYYDPIKPGGKLSIPAGVTLRITNKDMTPERSKGRSFTEKNGLFHSGLLKPGEKWTWVFRQPANFEIIDLGLNFATATLEVTP
ncbi:MAG: hypothetical protein WD646_03955 [Actinomycetota bacterium]